jgi:uncharacterized protein (TIGR00255 family)
MKISQRFASQEMSLRKLISNQLIRGKIDLLVSVESIENNEHSINKQAFSNYYNNISAVAKDIQIKEGDLLSTILRLPGVVEQNNDKVDEQQWQIVLQTIQEAVEALRRYRKEEGAATALDIQKRLQLITELLQAVHPEENERVEKIRARLMTSLEQLQLKGKVDENRLEQEMIYYLDKFDLNEEKMRLKQHCDYFVEEMQQDVSSKGKKLNFILQEMGREINTLGSKANSASIQRLVIQMKNEADKIKEQLANIL